MNHAQSLLYFIAFHTSTLSQDSCYFPLLSRMRLIWDFCPEERTFTVSTSPSWLFTTWGFFQREPHFYALKLPASRYSSLEWTSVYIRHLLCVRNCLGIWGTGGTGRELPPEAGSRPRRGTSPRACPPAPRRQFYLSLSFLKYFMHK